eukprot:COSAG02_NODE_58429_length_277_cov_0.870787_2_plen_27_part_01
MQKRSNCSVDTEYIRVSAGLPLVSILG